MFDALFEFVLEIILEIIFIPIYNYVLFPIFEPVCWLMGSIGVLLLTLGFIRPSTKKRSSFTGMWGYYQGKQYYFDRELVSAIGLLMWVICIFAFLIKLLLNS